MNLQKLTIAVADALEFPRATAIVLSRLGRERGLLSSGGRGRHAADATPRDAALLIIAMMASPTPARGPEYMRAFGDLELHPAFTYRDGTMPWEQELLPDRVLFCDALGSVLEILADPSRFILADGQPATGASVSIRDTQLSASITIMASHYAFQHAAWRGIDLKQMASSAAGEAGARAAAAVAPFRRRIVSEKHIGTDVLRPIATALRKDVV